MRSKEFNVIVYEFNSHKFEKYNVMPYFERMFKNKFKTKKSPDYPQSFDELKKFVEDESTYMFWSRCEWEVILSPWPPAKVDHDEDEKIDVHWQIMNNIDIVTEILMSNLKLDFK